jgi:hypothetical protein
VAHEHYRKLVAEHEVKNKVKKLIVESLPAHMKKPVCDSDGDPVLDDAGKPRMTVTDKHRPNSRHLGEGRYEFVVPGIDEATYRDLAARLKTQFGESILLLKPVSSA